MYQKDFIIFLIEQFARLLRRIIARIVNGDYDEADFMIEQVYRQYLGLNSDLINAFSYQYLMSMQRIDPDHYEDRCLVLAELLLLEGRILFERDVLKESFGRYLKAMHVFLGIFKESEAGKHEQRYSRIDDIEEKFAEIEERVGYLIPAASRELLADFRANGNPRHGRRAV